MGIEIKNPPVDTSILQEKPIAIADKATAYAETGVAVGTVYKTDDTG